MKKEKKNENTEEKNNNKKRQDGRQSRANEEFAEQSGWFVWKLCCGVRLEELKQD